MACIIRINFSRNCIILEQTSLSEMVTTIYIQAAEHLSELYNVISNSVYKRSKIKIKIFQ
jgi:hypothetical protein